MSSINEGEDRQVPMKGDWESVPPARATDPPEETWLDAVRQEVRRVNAPQSLRARIEAMIAVERRLGP